MPPVMNRAPMMNRPMMNRPQVSMNRPPMTPMNRVSSTPAATQGIAALLAAAAAKNPQSQMPSVGQQLPGSPINSELRNQEYIKNLMRAAQTMGGQMGGQMGLGQAMGSQLPEPQVPGSQPVRQDLSSMLTPEHLEQLRQLGSQGPMGQAQQVPIGMPFQAGATFDPSLSYNPMQTATPIGLGQAMGALRPYDPNNTTTQQDMMGGNRQAPQMNMLGNLSQMFNSMGQQQPAQQGGTPLQNNSSPLQQSAQPVMNMGVF